MFHCATSAFYFCKRGGPPPLTATLGNPQHTPAPGPTGGCPPHLSPSPASACFERDISRLMQHLPARPPQGMKDSQTPLHTKASGDAKAGRCRRKGNPGLPLIPIQAPNTLIACQLQEAFWFLGFFSCCQLVFPLWCGLKPTRYAASRSLAQVIREVPAAFAGVCHSQAKFTHPLRISFLLLNAALKINEGEGGDEPELARTRGTQASRRDPGMSV